MTDTPLDLTGSILIAMPGMADMSFADLLEQLDITPQAEVDGVRVYFGGPVETGRGFVLHSTEYTSDLRTLHVQEGVALTPTLDVLEDIAAGKGPRQVMMMLGYAGWGPGQLESELAQNGWLTCKGGADLIFDVPDRQKWSRALELLGINPALLSAEAGSA